MAARADLFKVEDTILGNCLFNVLGIIFYTGCSFLPIEWLLRFLSLVQPSWPAYDVNVKDMHWICFGETTQIFPPGKDKTQFLLKRQFFLPWDLINEYKNPISLLCACRSFLEISEYVYSRAKPFTRMPLWRSTLCYAIYKHQKWCRKWINNYTNVYPQSIDIVLILFLGGSGQNLQYINNAPLYLLVWKIF